MDRPKNSRSDIDRLREQVKRAEVIVDDAAKAFAEANKLCGLLQPVVEKLSPDIQASWERLYKMVEPTKGKSC